MIKLVKRTLTVLITISIIILGGCSTNSEDIFSKIKNEVGVKVEIEKGNNSIENQDRLSFVLPSNSESFQKIERTKQIIDKTIGILPKVTETTFTDNTSTQYFWEKSDLEIMMKSRFYSEKNEYRVSIWFTKK